MGKDELRAKLVLARILNLYVHRVAKTGYFIVMGFSNLLLSLGGTEKLCSNHDALRLFHSVS